METGSRLRYNSAAAANQVEFGPQLFTHKFFHRDCVV
jgi:hypothetical protein